MRNRKFTNARAKYGEMQSIHCRFTKEQFEMINRVSELNMVPAITIIRHALMQYMSNNYPGLCSDLLNEHTNVNTRAVVEEMEMEDDIKQLSELVGSDRSFLK